MGKGYRHRAYSPTNKPLTQSQGWLNIFPIESKHTNGINSISFADRLDKQLEQAPQRVTFNAQKKQYDWQAEGNQKRSIR